MSRRPESEPLTLHAIHSYLQSQGVIDVEKEGVKVVTQIREVLNGSITKLYFYISYKFSQSELMDIYIDDEEKHAKISRVDGGVSYIPCSSPEAALITIGDTVKAQWSDAIRATRAAPPSRGKSVSGTSRRARVI